MLGLTRGTVALFEHEENWIRQAKDTIDLLKRILGETAVDIQHAGSTSVPGLMAKPIIDIVIGVRSLDDLNPFAEKMEKEGNGGGRKFRREEMEEGENGGGRKWRREEMEVGENGEEGKWRRE